MAEPPVELVGVLMQLQDQEEDMEAVNNLVADQTPINVQMVFHVVTKTKGGQNRITDNVLLQQLDALNRAYAPALISFTLINIVRAVNAEWGASRDTDTMQRTLHQGDRKTLNLFFLEELKEKDGKPFLGVARLPTGLLAENGLEQDGCLVHADTLPGGGFQNKNSGKTAIHEAGHWFGLLHPFDNGCSGVGDGVADTPAERQPSFDCRPRHSCPDQPGQDAVDNFMDYGLDQCRSVFTSGQIDRARQLWKMFHLQGKRIPELKAKPTPANSLNQPKFLGPSSRRNVRRPIVLRDIPWQEGL
ncbi:pregnancy-associated plasma protein-A domain-containing protein [Hirsutella rhossiliensis]|uniref:Pregnancy-associated plasma protein-A domain-containing protein n=1 Tax=Hirsutella rhossiliensis TaxID=111463 RepID=A0A9P8MQ18_9HYPO|nr:pregnancy-associated plasma protein-A domain-containing protein [Hirsutella rhossiliensis]KAH0959648.1 pregnancy-associated plasma protein-A domain-containing protein [Hirsutella rhossiliensis]